MNPEMLDLNDVLEKLEKLATAPQEHWLVTALKTSPHEGVTITDNARGRSVTVERGIPGDADSIGIVLTYPYKQELYSPVIADGHSDGIGLVELHFTPQTIHLLLQAIYRFASHEPFEEVSDENES